MTNQPVDSMGRPELEAALSYATCGWSVFPVHSTAEGSCSCEGTVCTSPGKHPRTKHGFKDASSDAGVIRDWWRRWPNANIGLPTGQPSGVWVLDVDPRHGGGDSLDELEATYGLLPESVEVLTGGRGRHIYFRWTPGGPGNSEGKLGSGLDVRGEGGYVILPPSNHASGGIYEWEASSHPDDLDVADAPDWVIARLSASPEHTNHSRSTDSVIPWGYRRSVLLSLGGLMRSKGMTAEAIEAAFLAENSQRCEPPLERDEVVKLANDIANRYSPTSPIETTGTLNFLSPSDWLSQSEEPTEWH